MAELYQTYQQSLPCTVDPTHDTTLKCSQCAKPVCHAHLDRHECNTNVDRPVNFAEIIWLIIVAIVALILTFSYWW
jgi:hypothetical protein